MSRTAWLLTRPILAIAFCVSVQACGDDGAAPACNTGSEGCVCYGNRTCDGNLSCASNLCVDLSGGGQSGAGGTVSGTGGVGGSAGSGGTGGTTGFDAGGGVGAAGGVGGGGTGGSAGTLDQDAGELSPGTCVMASDCSLPGRCHTAMCASGMCLFSTHAPGYLLPDNITGDCQAHQCGSNGEVFTIANTLDPPPDPFDACIAGICQGATATLVPEPLGLACGSAQVCNGNGACVACKTDSTACNVGAECCNGACINHACTACPVDTADCDGDWDNACETSLTEIDNCGACGVSCSSLPHVTTATCNQGCTITRCAIGFVDADGVSANGCEATSTPWAPCTRANRIQTCGGGEECVMPTLSSGISGLDTCTTNATNCYCSAPCASSSNASACPASTGGTALKACASSDCYLDCTSNRTCPAGMTCRVHPGLILSGIRALCLPN